MYAYADFREKMLTNEGQQWIVQALLKAQRLHRQAGAFAGHKLLDGLCIGDTWTQLAVLDRLVELGIIRLANPEPHSVHPKPIYVLCNGWEA